MRGVAVREQQHRQRRAGARRRVNERPGLHPGQVIEGGLRLPHQGGERAGLLHAGAEIGRVAALGAVHCRIPRQDLHLTLLRLVAEGLGAGVVDHGERRRADREGSARLRELEGRPRRGGWLRRCLRDHARGESDRKQREGDQPGRDQRGPGRIDGGAASAAPSRRHSACGRRRCRPVCLRPDELACRPPAPRPSWTQDSRLKTQDPGTPQASSPPPSRLFSMIKSR